jgi:hypothetical protein
VPSMIAGTMMADLMMAGMINADLEAGPVK